MKNEWTPAKGVFADDCFEKVILYFKCRGSRGLLVPKARGNTQNRSVNNLPEDWKAGKVVHINRFLTGTGPRLEKNKTDRTAVMGQLSDDQKYSL
jgi:hypothetical protein